MGAAAFAVGASRLAAGGLVEGAFVTCGSLLLILAAAQGVLTRVVVRRRAVTTIRAATVSDIGQAAAIIPYSRPLFWLILSLPVLLLVGIVPIAGWAVIEMFVEPGAGNIVVVAVCVICGAYLLASVGEFLFKRIVCGYVALSPEGVFHRSWALTSFVPWEQVVAIWPVEGSGPVITVQAMANGGGWSRRTSRFWRQSESGFGLDLTIRGMYLSVDPALVYYAMQFYCNNPQARSELSGDAAVLRLKRADVPVPSRCSSGGAR
jgi:hypothetical protein